MTDPAPPPRVGLEALHEHVKSLCDAHPFEVYGPTGKGGLPGDRFPLDPILVLRREDHWHYVGFGLSELDHKVSDREDLSGWGFELTLRLRAAEGETEAPSIGLDLLQELSCYVFDTGNTFGPGHTMPQRSERVPFDAALFVADPELGTVSTPHGEVTFLQIVGVTDDERDACRGWSGLKFAELLAARDPLLVTTPNRSSLLEDASVRAQVEEGIERDGSAVGGVLVDFLRCVPSTGSPPPLLIQLSGEAVEGLQGLLRGRTRHGRPACLAGKEERLLLQSGPVTAWHTGSTGETVLIVDPDMCSALVEDLQPGPRELSWPSVPWLSVSVVSEGRAPVEP